MKKKVVIIGGGVSGLSAGIYSAMNGFDTEILEMHSVAGGQCTAWERKNFRFDYCLHWLVGTSKGAFHEIWKETNVLNDHTEIIDHEIHSQIIDRDGNTFIIYSNIDRWEKYLLDIAPEDATPDPQHVQGNAKKRPAGAFYTAPGIKKPARLPEDSCPRCFPFSSSCGNLGG